MHADGRLLAKEALGILAHDAGEDVEHSGVGAATFPAIVAGLEEAEFFGGIEGEECGIVERFQPSEVALGLGGEEDEIFGAELKEASGSLFALGVIFFDGGKGVVAGKLHGAASLIAASAGDIT